MRLREFTSKTRKPITESRLDELFDSGSEPTLVKANSGHFVYEFVEEGVVYRVYFEYIDDNSFEVSYGYSVPGDRVHFKPAGDKSTKHTVNVLSSVIKCVLNFLRTKKPEYIEFTGDKEVGLSEFYKKVIKSYGGKLRALGYSVDLDVEGAHTAYFEIKRLPEHIDEAVALHELFDSSLKPQLVSDTGTKVLYSFSYEDEEYETVFYRLWGKNDWEVAYYLLHPERGKVFDPSGWGSSQKAIKVLSTVLECVDDFLSTHKPEAVIFAGDKKNGLGKFYKTLVRTQSNRFKHLGYAMENGREHDLHYDFAIRRISDDKDAGKLEEDADAGVTSAGDVATVVEPMGVGTAGHYGIYDKQAKKGRKKKSKPLLLRR